MIQELAMMMSPLWWRTWKTAWKRLTFLYEIQQKVFYINVNRNGTFRD